MKRMHSSRGNLALATLLTADTVTPGEARPSDGDVVIRRTAQAGSRYTLGTFPVGSQLQYSSYSLAVEVARRFAQQQQVDCWLTRDGSTFRLLGRHRSEQHRLPA